MDRNIVHLKHSSGADVNIIAIYDMYGAFGVMELCGTAGFAQVAHMDSFYSSDETKSFNILKAALNGEIKTFI